MSADDDNDCEHVWVPSDLVMHRGQLDLALTCSRCGAVAYEPSPNALRDRRPPL